MNTTLVICEDASIHKAGCKDSKKRGMNPAVFAEDFFGSTVLEFVAWYARDWKDSTGEDITDREWLDLLADEIRPCTGLK